VMPLRPAPRRSSGAFSGAVNADSQDVERFLAAIDEAVETRYRSLRPNPTIRLGWVDAQVRAGESEQTLPGLVLLFASPLRELSLRPLASTPTCSLPRSNRTRPLKSLTHLPCPVCLGAAFPGQTITGYHASRLPPLAMHAISRGSDSASSTFLTFSAVLCARARERGLPRPEGSG
jgi:hypothetical protein